MVLRFGVAFVLMASAALKGLDALDGSLDGPAVAVIVVECALALALVAPDRPPRFVETLVIGFLLVTIGYGIYRSWGAQGFQGQCGCLGKRVDLKTWQQLLLSGSLLIGMGATVLVDGARAEEHGRA